MKGMQPQRTRTVESYPDCPDCETNMPVVGTSDPEGGVYECLRCGLEFSDGGQR